MRISEVVLTTFPLYLLQCVSLVDVNNDYAIFGYKDRLKPIVTDGPGPVLMVP